MNMRHLAVLVEEPSMEEFLRILLPRILPEDCGFEVHSFRGKAHLLRNLQARLRGYARWLPDDWRVIVVVDRDNDDCRVLKRELEEAATAAGLHTRSQVDSRRWQLANRIAIEELEAWYFGDWQAVRCAYPRVSDGVSRQARYRNPDAIRGAWEAFERILQRRGYFATGLRKVEAARAVAVHIDPDRNRSESFKIFCAAVVEAFPHGVP